MIFVFDLDNTLLDTAALFRAYISEKLKPLGISEGVFIKAIEFDRRLRTTERPTTAATILEALRTVSTNVALPMDAEQQFLNFISNRALQFYYPDTFSVIPALSGKKIILTKGSHGLQIAKMTHEKVRGLFDGLHVVKDFKHKFLAPLAAARKGERIIFVDDTPEEHIAALGAIPDLLSIHIIRQGVRRDPLVHPRCFVVENLEQLQNLTTEDEFG